MKSEEQYLAECRAANPQPIFSIINGEKVQLTSDEYEQMLKAWARMRYTQENLQDESNS